MILDVKNLTTTFDIESGIIFRKVVSSIKAVNNVSFSVQEGETLGIVGESGSGKTTLARTILRLVHAQKGKVMYKGQDLLTLSASEYRPLRKELQVVFQDPESSLNPKMTVFDIVSEGAKNYRLYRKKKELQQKVQSIFEEVGMPPTSMYRYPHEFSGGQRQRIGIARALMMEPKVLIADEPVSALDLSIQAQILGLFNKIKKDFNLTMMFIAHNLAVIRNVSDRIIVMYLGKIMEMAPTHDLFNRQRHPYTQALVASVLAHHADKLHKRRFVTLKGEIPSPAEPPSGCVFRTRCPKAQDVCEREEPPLAEDPSGHWTACHFKD